MTCGHSACSARQKRDAIRNGYVPAHQGRSRTLRVNGEEEISMAGAQNNGRQQCGNIRQQQHTVRPNELLLGRPPRSSLLQMIKSKRDSAYSRVETSEI